MVQLIWNITSTYFCAGKLMLLTFFCYREKESSDEGTQESIKVREDIYRKTVYYLPTMEKMTMRDSGYNSISFLVGYCQFCYGTCNLGGCKNKAWKNFKRSQRWFKPALFFTLFFNCLSYVHNCEIRNIILSSCIIGKCWEMHRVLNLVLGYWLHQSLCPFLVHGHIVYPN